MRTSWETTSIASSTHSGSPSRLTSEHVALALGLLLVAMLTAAQPSAAQPIQVWYDGELVPAQPVESYLFLAPNASSAAILYLDSVGLDDFEYFGSSCGDGLVFFTRPVASGTPVMTSVADIVDTYGTQVPNNFFWTLTLDVDGAMELSPTAFLYVRFEAGTSTTAAQTILYQLDIGVIVDAAPDGWLIVQSFSRSGLEVVEQVNLLAARSDVELVGNYWEEGYCQGPSGGGPGSGPTWGPVGRPGVPQIPTLGRWGLWVLLGLLAVVGVAKLRR